MPRRAVVALGFLATALLVLGLAPTASAHDYLVSSTPGEGDQLERPPTEVELSFNTSVGEQFAQVAVVDVDGATYQVGDPVVAGPTVTQQVADLPPGRDYTVSYRVVSSDGHPIGGTVGFSVAGTASDGAADQPDASGQDDVAAEQQGDSSAREASPTGAGAGVEAADETAPTGGPMLWVVGAVVLALLGALGVGLTRRRSATGS